MNDKIGNTKILLHSQSAYTVILLHGRSALSVTTLFKSCHQKISQKQTNMIYTYVGGASVKMKRGSTLSLAEFFAQLKPSHSPYILKEQKQILITGSYWHARDIPYYSEASLNSATGPYPVHICNNFSNIHLITVPPRMSANRSVW